MQVIRKVALIEFHPKRDMAIRRRKALLRSGYDTLPLLIEPTRMGAVQGWGIYQGVV